MTKLNRYTYAVNEIEDFQELLDFWVRTHEITYPVFMEWLPGDDHCATFWLETELYRASVTVSEMVANEFWGRHRDKIHGQHSVIECFVYAGDTAD